MEKIVKKLRLLLLEECNRTCEGCCNKDWDINKLETENSFDQYSLIMITGGEPLLVPVTLMLAISDIRDQTEAPWYCIIPSHLLAEYIEKPDARTKATMAERWINSKDDDDFKIIKDQV